MRFQGGSEDTRYRIFIQRGWRRPEGSSPRIVQERFQPWPQLLERPTILSLSEIDSKTEVLLALNRFPLDFLSAKGYPWWMTPESD